MYCEQNKLFSQTPKASKNGQLGCRRFQKSTLSRFSGFSRVIRGNSGKYDINHISWHYPLMYKYSFWPNTSTNSRNIYFQFFFILCLNWTYLNDKVRYCTAALSLYYCSDDLIALHKWCLFVILLSVCEMRAHTSHLHYLVAEIQLFMQFVQNLKCKW